MQGASWREGLRPAVLCLLDAACFASFARFVFGQGSASAKASLPRRILPEAGVFLYRATLPRRFLPGNDGVAFEGRVLGHRAPRRYAPGRRILGFSPLMASRFRAASCSRAPPKSGRRAGWRVASGSLARFRRFDGRIV